MCGSCWRDEYGGARLDSPEIRKAEGLIRAVYDQIGGGVGGGLHIVVDDWNLETEHIQWCIDDGLTDVERECAELLLTMTESERASALARYDELI